MARIRTIKPELPQSETIGRLSRDARLLFIQLWTIVDDAGRTRAASRMLASLLYPYDDDAKTLIDGWLTELEQEDCIRRYEVDGDRYLEIANWLKHQKIDKPSKSRLPAFDEASRLFAKPLEPSATDLGPSTDDLVPGTEVRADARVPVPRETQNNPEPDPRKELFGKGLEVLARITGRTPNSCRSLVGRWLKSVDDEAIHVLAAIEDAERDRIADPTSWITARLNGKGRPHGFGGSRPLQDDSRSVSRAAGRLADQAERGEFAFGPRPRLVPEENPDPVRLLSKG